MREEMERVRDENFPDLRDHPAFSGLGFGTIRLDSPQRKLVGIKLDFDSTKLQPGGPSPEEIYPEWIGCVPFEVKVGGPACAGSRDFGTQVVDDETGTPIKGAYWRSETLDGDVFLELEEEKAREDDIYQRYFLVGGGSVIAEQAKRSGSADFRVVVAKEGYTTLVRQFTATANSCHIQDVEGDREFRMVKGPPGENDVFRKVSYPEGATVPMAQYPASLKYHSATLLQDGRVLVVGEGNTPNSVEVYDPVSNSWTPHSELTIVRRTHGEVVLQDSRVLVAGGIIDRKTELLESAELFGPTGEWLGEARDMAFAHYINTLTLLNDGRVLVVGGGTASTELYDPKDNTWSLAGEMSVVRLVHTATLLSDGRVLATGGIDDATASDFVNNSAEVFDPASGGWFQTRDMTGPRSRHTATLLMDGRVMVVGGRAYSGRALATSEIYHPPTGIWIQAPSLSHTRYNHTATLLLDGRILVAGGRTIGGRGTREAEIYDPSTGTWTAAAQMKKERYLHTATRLTDGRVLVVGGTLGTAMYASAEIYDPVKDSWD